MKNKINILTACCLALSISNICSQNLALNKPATASASSNNAYTVFDGKTSTAWGAGSWAPAWVSVDLQNLKEISSVKCTPMQSPAGNTTHQIFILNESKTWEKVDEFTLYTKDSETFERIINRNGYAVKVVTTNSPSWVAWYEIEIVGSTIKIRRARPVSPELGTCISGDCQNGFGTLVYPDTLTIKWKGSKVRKIKHIGNFINGRRSGEGTTYYGGTEAGVPNKVVGKFERGKLKEGKYFDLQGNVIEEKVSSITQELVLEQPTASNVAPKIEYTKEKIIEIAENFLPYNFNCSDTRTNLDKLKSYLLDIEYSDSYVQSLTAAYNATGYIFCSDILRKKFRCSSNGKSENICGYVSDIFIAVLVIKEKENPKEKERKAAAASSNTRSSSSSSNSSLTSNDYSVSTGQEYIKKIEKAQGKWIKVEEGLLGDICNKNFSFLVKDKNGKKIGNYDDLNYADYDISEYDQFPLSVEISYFTDSNCSNGDYIDIHLTLNNKNVGYVIWIKS